MQTDWGAEYQKLSSFFSRIGISHLVFCPHTHQQNGAAMRKHRHIVEVGLSLLSHASMPLKFWDESYLTAVFLINHLPSRVINMQMPIERLFATKPDYSFLRIFGCACWPNLRPYNMHKLAFHSMRCAFLGYSNQHKGYKCLDISSGRVYISRDVIFDETGFPFSELHPNAGTQLRSEILLLRPTLRNPQGNIGADVFDVNNFANHDVEDVLGHGGFTGEGDFVEDSVASAMDPSAAHDPGAWRDYDLLDRPAVGSEAADSLVSSDQCAGGSSDQGVSGLGAGSHSPTPAAAPTTTNVALPPEDVVIFSGDPSESAPSSATVPDQRPRTRLQNNICKPKT